jgi:ATP-dependent Lon protease
VLFPGALMPLHVFEPRYRQMMAYCLERDRSFGLIYHDPDRFGPFDTEPGRVGCIARILKFQPLPDGRSLVLTEGLERFRIEDGIESDALYFEALVEEYPDLDGQRRGIVRRRQASVELFHRVLREALHHPGPLPPVSTRDETAFQLAQAIRIDPAWQQELLETRGERARLDRLDFLFQAILEGDDPHPTEDA